MADKALLSRLVVHDLENMKPTDRRRLLHWLEQMVDFIKKTEPEKFGPRFTARLFKQ